MKLGRVLGFSCIDRLTRPFRYPNSVPLTRVPEDMVRLESILPPGRDGILQAVGVMIGKDRKTDLKTRKTLPLLFFLMEGWTRDEGWPGSGGGSGAAVVFVEEEEEEDGDGGCCSFDGDFVGSPINGVGDPGMGECHERERGRERQ